MDKNFDELEQRLKKADPANNANITLGENVLTKAIKNGKSSTTSKRPTFGIATLAGLATASVAAVALVGLNLTGLNTNNDEMLLSLSGEQGAGQQNAVMGAPESGVADKSMMWFPNYNYIYVAGEELSKEAGRGNAYKFELTGDPEAELKKLAKVFSLTGEVTQDPYGYDKLNWAIGDYKNYNKAQINLYWNGMGSWYYSNPEANTSTSTGCNIDSGTVSSEDSPSTKDREVVGDKTEPGQDSYPNCVFLPPTGLPTDSEALNEAYTLLTSTGADLEKESLTVFSDEWGVYVSGNQKVEGQEVSVNFSVSWAGPEVSYASGNLANIVLVKDVPLISAYDAVARLSDWIWFGSYPQDPGMAYPMVMNKSDSAMIEPGFVSDTGDSSGEESSTDPSGGSIDGSEPYEGDDWVAPEPEDLEVLFNKSTKRLLLVWDSNGTSWLLPGYVYSTDVKEYYGMASVVAVDSSVINLNR